MVKIDFPILLSNKIVVDVVYSKVFANWLAKGETWARNKDFSALLAEDSDGVEECA